MGGVQWKGDLWDTVVGGEDRRDQRELSKSHICGSTMSLKWFLVKVGDTGPPSTPHQDT